MNKLNLRGWFFPALLLSMTLFYNSCSKNTEVQIEEMEDHIVVALQEREDFRQLFHKTKEIAAQVRQRIQHFSPNRTPNPTEVGLMAEDELLGRHFAELAITLDDYILNHERLQDLPLDMGYNLLSEAIMLRNQSNPGLINIRNNDDPEEMNCLLTAVGAKALITEGLSPKTAAKAGLSFAKKSLLKFVPVVGWASSIYAFSDCMGWL